MRLFNILILALSLLLAAVSFAAESAAESETKAVIIDVRTAVEYQAEHLEGAINIPYDRISESIEQAVPDKKAKVILYCRSGRRSGIALETLKKIGYEDVINLMTVQEAAGKLNIPLVKGDK